MSVSLSHSRLRYACLRSSYQFLSTENTTGEWGISITFQHQWLPRRRELTGNALIWWYGFKTHPPCSVSVECFLATKLRWYSYDDQQEIPLEDPILAALALMVFGCQCGAKGRSNQSSPNHCYTGGNASSVHPMLQAINSLQQLIGLSYHGMCWGSYIRF